MVVTNPGKIIVWPIECIYCNMLLSSWFNSVFPKLPRFHFIASSISIHKSLHLIPVYPKYPINPPSRHEEKQSTEVPVSNYTLINRQPLLVSQMGLDPVNHNFFHIAARAAQRRTPNGCSFATPSTAWRFTLFSYGPLLHVLLPSEWSGSRRKAAIKTILGPDCRSK